MKYADRAIKSFREERVCSRSKFSNKKTEERALLNMLMIAKKTQHNLSESGEVRNNRDPTNSMS